MLLPPAEMRLITAELAPGERILWSSRPDPLVAAMSHVPGLGASIFFLSEILRLYAKIRDGGLEAIFGLGMLVIVCWVTWVLGRQAYREMLGEFYAITDRRLFIASSRGRSLKSIQRNAIHEVEWLTRRNKVTLRFPTAIIGAKRDSASYTSLHGIDDGHRAFHLLTRIEPDALVLDQVFNPRSTLPSVDR